MYPVEKILDEVIDNTCLNIATKMSQPKVQFFTESAILIPKYNDVAKINEVQLEGWGMVF